MDIKSLFIVFLVAVVALNVVTAILWVWLTFLVKSSGSYIGDQTAYIYTKLLFGRIMESRFNPSPDLTAIGNPDRDPVMRAVRSSEQFAFIEWIASWLKELPLNLVPRMV